VEQRIHHSQSLIRIAWKVGTLQKKFMGHMFKGYIFLNTEYQFVIKLNLLTNY